MGETTNTAERIDCPIEGKAIEAATPEGLAVRLIEHYVRYHPGGLPPVVTTPVQSVLDDLKAKFH
jgi:hypothetical protein